MIELSKNYIYITNSIVIALCAYFVIRGYRKGFLVALLSFAGSIISFLGAFITSSVFYVKLPILKVDATDYVTQQMQMAIYPFVNRIIWFAILLIVMRIVLAIVNKILQSLHKVPVYHFFSSIGGSLIGLIETCMWVLFLSLFLQSPIFSNGNDIVNQTILSPIKVTTKATAKEVLTMFMDPLQQDVSFNDVYDKVEHFTDRNLEKLLSWLEKNGYRG